MADQHLHSLGSVLATAFRRREVLEILDASYGIEDVDWRVETQLGTGIVISFLDPKQAMRFKLTWKI